jgi:hypothetical protein
MGGRFMVKEAADSTYTTSVLSALATPNCRHVNEQPAVADDVKHNPSMLMHEQRPDLYCDQSFL